MLLEFSTKTMSTCGSSDVSGYDPSIVMISYQICTEQRCLLVCHWVTIALLTNLLCV